MQKLQVSDDIVRIRRCLICPSETNYLTELINVKEMWKCTDAKVNFSNFICLFCKVASNVCVLQMLGWILEYRPVKSHMHEHLRNNFQQLENLLFENYFGNRKVSKKCFNNNQ